MEQFDIVGTESVLQFLATPTDQQKLLVLMIDRVIAHTHSVGPFKQETGSTLGAGRIYRDKTSGEIVAFSELETYQMGIERLASDIAELHKRKTRKQYPRGTNLLVAFEDPTFFGQDQWRALFAELRLRSDLSGGFFSDTHIFNCGTNELMSNANF